MVEQRTGQYIIVLKQKARKNFTNQLLLGMRVWRFAKILKKNWKKAKFERNKPLPARRIIAEVSEVLKAAKVIEFSKNCQFYSVKRTELSTFNKARLTEFYRDIITRQSSDDLTFKFDGRLFLVTDSKSNIFRVLYPARVSSVERLSHSEYKSVVFCYGPVERIILSSIKQEIQNLFFDQLVAISGIFSSLSLSKDWYPKKDRNRHRS